LLPLGGPEGYKGYGLSFMVEVFSGLLTGIGFGIDPDGIHNDGITVTAFNVSHFRDLAEFKTEVGEFVAYLKDTPLAEGVDEILYPGELEHRTMLARTASGIEIEDETWAALEELTDRLGVAR
jgi:LDH2 family malate/lactate/ureidoglycolate dehydrogenase